MPTNYEGMQQAVKAIYEDMARLCILLRREHQALEGFDERIGAMPYHDEGECDVCDLLRLHNWELIDAGL